MSTTPYLLPPPLGRVLGRLPAWPGSLLFVSGLNLVLKDAFPTDVTTRLLGKKLRIAVQDARVAFDFEWREGRFQACRHAGTIDLTIGASAHDFLLLAQRKEDPDTLFFSRRLTMEGETELGLMVKNALDAIDLPVFELGRLLPGRVLAQLRARVERRG